METRSIRARTIKDNIRIDGHLNEAVWQTAEFQGDFKQREPFEGEPASERTSVAVLQNDRYIYFGIQCFDRQPSAIIATEKRRDAWMDCDDYFQLVLDTFHDRRNAYYFIVNPFGNKRDATLANEGEEYNPHWDGIWSCGAHVGEQGWFAEIAIPWKSLRYAVNDSCVWGVNFSRMIRRKNETVYWQLVPRDIGGMGFFRISLAGELTGLNCTHKQSNLEFLPFITAGAQRDSNHKNATKTVKELGLDIRTGLTSNVVAHFTLNTDFAQVESDRERINLSRFSLYYPEKRDFFLEGDEVFRFNDQIDLFYSRRIGLVEGMQQPILGGARLLGKNGRFQFGFLNIQTERVRDEKEDREYPAVNYTALTLKRDMFERGNWGVMALNKQNTDCCGYNRSAGVNFHMPLSNYVSLSGALAGTFNADARAEKHLAGNFDITYASDLWQSRFSILDIQENFNAEMGFIRRTDIRRIRSRLYYMPRPLNWPAVRKLYYRLRSDYMVDHQNTMLESEIDASFMMLFENSSRIMIGGEWKQEYIDENWQVRPGFLIPATTYCGYEGDMYFETDESSDLSGEFMLSYGDYYTGRYLRLRPELTLRRLHNTRLDLDFSYNNVRLPAGNFEASTLGFRFFYFFSTRMYAKAYIQYNSDRKANDGKVLGLGNFLFRWIYRPGSDLYLVYNENRSFGPAGDELTNRTLLLKATFFWQS